MTHSTSKEPSPHVAATVSAVIGLVMFGLAYFISNYRPPKVLWEPAQAEFEPIATLVPSGSTQVIGRLQSWEARPTTGRNIVLCQLIDETPIPYDCRVTPYHTITDNESRFQIDNVQPGKYLILYNSGLADFEQGYAQWQDKILRIGDYEWVSHNLLGGEPDGGFITCIGSNNGFYRSHVDLTLGASGSPFGLAHDVDLASAYQGEEFTLPQGVFKPLLVEVVKNQTSNIQFKALHCTPKSR